MSFQFKQQIQLLQVNKNKKALSTLSRSGHVICKLKTENLIVANSCSILYPERSAKLATWIAPEFKSIEGECVIFSVVYFIRCQIKQSLVQQNYLILLLRIKCSITSVHIKVYNVHQNHYLPIFGDRGRKSRYHPVQPVRMRFLFLLA